MNRRLDHDWFSEPLPENVQIGERSWLYSTYAFRHFCSRRPVALRIGNDTGVYNGTFFDVGPDGEVVIGDVCTIVGAIISTNARVVIGDYTFIAHDVVLADEPVGLPRGSQAVSPIFPSALLRRRDIVLAENVWIGTRAVLLGGANIGEGAIVGAGAVVDGDVAPFTVVAGNPARVVKVIDRR